MEKDLPIPFEGTQTKKPVTTGKIGRPKGSKNKKGYLLATAQREIEQKFGVKGFDPVVFLMITAADPTQDMELRIAAAVKAAPYIHPTAKPVVINDDNKKDKPVDVERLMNKVARELLIENHVVVENVTEEPPSEDDEEDIEENEPPGI